jgi:hypothetical protein
MTRYWTEESHMSSKDLRGGSGISILVPPGNEVLLALQPRQHQAELQMVARTLMHQVLDDGLIAHCRGSPLEIESPSYADLENLASKPFFDFLASIFLRTSSSTSPSSSPPHPYQTTVPNPSKAVIIHPTSAPIALGVQPYVPVNG